MTSHGAAATLLTALLLTAAGCGGTDSVSVRGAVTLDGKPVTEGSLVFLTADGAGAASAVVRDGRFELAGDQAPRPGKYRVEVRWSRPTGRTIPSADPGMMTEETREAIPARYNKDSSLSAVVQPGENIIDFPLTSN